MAERKYKDYFGRDWAEDTKEKLKIVIQANLNLIKQLGICIERDIDTAESQLPNLLYCLDLQSLRDFIEEVISCPENRLRGLLGVQIKNLPGVKGVNVATDNLIHAGGLYVSYLLPVITSSKKQLTACGKEVSNFLLTTENLAITCIDCLIEINKTGLRFCFSEKDGKLHLANLFAEKTVCLASVKNFIHSGNEWVGDFDECEECYLKIGQEIVTQFLLVP